MAHYDGPPFLRGDQPQEKAAYPLPPKAVRQPQVPTPKPQPVAEPTTPAVGRHSVDPLAALSTPKSVVRRTKPPRIDYQLVLAHLQRQDDAVYLFTTAESDVTPGPMDDQAQTAAESDSVPRNEEPATAGDTTIQSEPAAAGAEPSMLAPTNATTTAREDDQVSSAEDHDGRPQAQLDHQPHADDQVALVATEADEASANSTPTVDAEQARDTAPARTKKPPLLPSQTDPLKQAQQALIEKTLAKQKKTVYANWRPRPLPNRSALRQAVDTYQHHEHDKQLPKPVASRQVPQTPVQPVVTETKSEVTPPASSTPVPDAARPESMTAVASAAEPYQLPPLDLLPKPVVDTSPEQDQWVVAQAERLDQTLTAFHVDAHVVAHTIGPTVTQFQVALDAGVKVNKITNLNDDLKLALAAKDIRIEAPIPGKTTVGIEIPNLHPRPVMLREVLGSQAFQAAKSPLTIALGVDLFGQPVVTNINKMPHGLIAGATGSGKSVFINSLLTSLLYKATPEEVRLLLIDPKAVELAVYNNLPHLVSPVISEPKAAAEALKWAVEEMENRYQKMAAAGVRNLAQFNQKAKAHGDFGLVLPYVVIIIDELADLMMVAASEVQDYIARITQKARAAGIHLIVATQRPSVDVITGTIKNNIPTRIAFMVASQTDSRTIIDANGAERLLGRGDMLYLGSGASQAIRLQGTFIDEDIAAVVDFVKQERPPRYLFQPDGLLAKAEASEAQDDLFPQVLDYIAQEKQVSTSKLQRVFSIGYNRAANLIDELEMRHYISPANGSKPRDVYFTKEDLPENPQ